MTKNFKHYLEPEQPLTHEFFNTLYWYAYSRDSRHPQTGVRSFLGLIKDLNIKKFQHIYNICFKTNIKQKTGG